MYGVLATGRDCGGCMVWCQLQGRIAVDVWCVSHREVLWWIQGVLFYHDMQIS